MAYQAYLSQNPLENTGRNRKGRNDGMRSDAIKSGVDRGLARSLMMAGGLDVDQVKRPIIGVVNSYTNLFTGHATLDKIGEYVKEGILMAGGTPAMTSTIALCDGLCENTPGMLYPLPSRDLIADSVECYVEGHMLDGLVCIASCDKIVPGMLMAMMRLDIPCVMITGGNAMPATVNGKKVDSNEIIAKTMAAKTGKIDLDELMKYEEGGVLVGCGPACMTGLGTALSMQIVSEVLGVGVQGNSTVPAFYTRRIHMARHAGKRIVEMVKEDLRPSAIISRQSFLNCLAVDMMMGCSTNSALHIPAIAAEAGYSITLDDFDEASRKTPQIVKISPSSNVYSPYDFFLAGGLEAVIKLGIEAGYFDGSTMTYMGKTMAEMVQNAAVNDPECIRSFDNPYTQRGGLAVLKGNLAPEGCVIKSSGVLPEMWEHTGTAKVFDTEMDCFDALNAGKIVPGDCIVIRYEGPVGGPGMREMLTITNVMRALDLSPTVSLITDGRFSGGSVGGVIGHVAPEAAVGGLIALVEDGDIIEYSIPKGTIELKVRDEVLAERRAGWSPPKPRKAKGFLARYAQLAASPVEGARMIPESERKYGEPLR